MELPKAVYLLILALIGSVQGFKSCSPNPCKQGATCILPADSSKEAYCECGDKYVGEYCQYDNPCSPDVPRCLNGGTCKQTISERGISATCQCTLGYTGTMCEFQDKNSVCASDPCMNGGTCQLDGSLSKYKCLCSSSYWGDRCELRDNCVTKPCLNNGSCRTNRETPTGYTCQCLPGFRGTNCRDDVNECVEKGTLACHNGGSCENQIGTYRCLCTPEFTGPNCEFPYIPCSPSPCLHGGSCIVQSAVTYECRCVEGFTGQDCQNNIDDCRNNQCANGATCIDGVQEYTCRCPSQWTGIMPFGFGSQVAMQACTFKNVKSD